jgi:hypothetical protein
MEVEGEVRSEHQRLAWDSVAQPAQNALDSSSKFWVVIRLGDVILGDLVQQVSLAVGRIERGPDRRCAAS